MPYVLDTNIISEVMKPHPNFETVCWLQDHESELFLTSVTVMELNYGVMRLPEGKRKENLRQVLDIISKEESRKTYVFDSFSAYLCAELRCKAGAAGHTPQLSDCMIAAICKRNGAILATHNVKDFECFGIDIVDPFAYESPSLKELRQRNAQHAPGV